MNVNSVSCERNTGTKVRKGGLRFTKLGLSKCHSWQSLLTQRDRREWCSMQNTWKLVRRNYPWLSSRDTYESSNEESDLGDLDFKDKMTLSYESLSLGDDFRNLFGRDYHSILVRKEYRDMFDHISARRAKRLA